MTTTRTRPNRLQRDLTVDGIAVISTLVAWAAWRAGGVDPAVSRGSQQTTVGAVAVVVAALGTALLGWLEARSTHGLRTWTAIALVVGLRRSHRGAA